MAGTDGFTMDMETAVLRAMDATPELCSEMPLWGSSAVKRTWQVGELLPKMAGFDLVALWNVKWHVTSLNLAIQCLLNINLYQNS